MTIALLGRGGTGWVESLAGLCRGPTRLLDLLAPLRGGEVLVDGDRILWQGFDLATADAVLIERPLFSWPQPGVDPQAGATGPGADREARALALSALHAAAEAVPVLDPPRAADLAVSPLHALDRCAAAGLRVHPWRLVPERPAEDGGRVWLDPAGADLWYCPSPPRAGEPAWGPEPFRGPVLSLLAADGRAVGARRFADASAWVRGRPREVLRAETVPADAGETGTGALRALELSWLQVDLLEGPDGPAILSLQAGVDPAPWDVELGGAVAAALAERLDRVARGER